MLKTLKGIKNIKLKVMSIFMLITLMSLQLSPFMLNATAAQLNFYSPGLVTPATDTAYNVNVYYSSGTLGGDIAYCLDYGKPLPSGTMSYYKTLSAQGLSLLVYGYPNVTPAELGCASAEEAYMATQMAFWTVMMRTGESDGPRVFNLDNVYAKPGYEEFMQRAAAAAKRLNAKAIASPYVANPELNIVSNNAKLENKNGEMVTGPYVLKVTGGNVVSIKASLQNAPSSAKITDANGNVKTTFANNEAVYVKFDEKEEGTTMTLNAVADADKLVGSIYMGDAAAQKFVKLDTVPVEVAAAVNIKYATQVGEIEVIKVDQHGNKVAGAKFELRNANNEKIAEGTTGTDGYIKFSNIKVGDYKVVEVSTPEGYIKNTQTKEVKVKAGETVRIEVENEKIEGTLEIVKVDENENAIPNVTFEILNANKEKIAEVTTGADGKAKVSNLGVGKYYYQETKAPVNVIMNKTLKEFSITETNKEVVEKVVNEKVKGSLKIIKVDENNAPVEGVTFEIFDSNKKVIEKVKTNASGIAVSKELAIGTYYYKEVSGPANIVVDSTEYEFKVTSAGQVIEKTVVNKLARGHIEILKVDDSNAPIEGVKFNILDSNKNIVETITTGKDGKATSKELVLGTYYYKEVEAPSNVIMDGSEHEFKLVNCAEVVKKTVVNAKVKGSLNIVKIDENKNVVPGVTFNILDSNKKVIDTIITDKDGKASSKELPVGTYYYKEVSAPSNVKIDTNTYIFKLTEQNTVINKVIINKLAKGHLEILKVDEDSNPIEGVKFEILDSNKNVVDTIVTGKDGKASSKELVYGKYYYKEIDAPVNYIFNSTEYEFSLTACASIIKKTIVNELAKGHLEILKVDENSNPIEGVKFNILDSNKNVVETITTGKDGKAASKELSLGTYYYKEVKAPENYVVDGTEYEFKLVKCAEVIKKTVVNNLVKGHLEILKVDENSNPIEGVKFNILDSNKNVVETITTGKDGKATSKKLAIGTYYYKEISAPESFVVDKNEYVFNISKENEIVTKKVVNKSVEGKLKIVKTDEKNTPIEGVTFYVLDSNKKIVDIIVTNREGIAESKELKIGTYYYKEISAPENYVLDTKEYNFNVTVSNRAITKTVVNKFAKGHLEIVKVDETNKAIEGVKFNILDSNKNVVDTITTGKDGKAVSKDLELGTYYYKEVEAPSNVVMDNAEYEFKLTSQNKVVNKTVVNKFAKGHLEIVKVDETNKAIEGVKFNILDSNKNVIETITTGKDGKVTSKDLTYGKYYYKEVEAPSDFVVETTEYEFSVTENNQVITKTVVNKLAKGKLEIVKIDETNKAIEGVKFNILDSNKNVIETIATGKDGKASSSPLRKGTYYYKEVSAPEGFVVDNEMYKFVITGDNEKVVKNVINNYIKGRIEILKVDDENLPVEGVKFNILDENNKVIETIITGEDGKATSNLLRYGKYYYVEVQTPDKYVIDNNKYEFNISKNGEIITKTVVNVKKYGVLQILKLDEDTKMPISGVAFNIVDFNGNIVDTITTDEYGIARTKNLELGTYTFYEVSAPNGYIVDDNAYQFKLTKHMGLKKFTVYNSKQKLPVTGGVVSTNTMIVFVVAIISIFGYSLMKVLEYRKQN